jgi:murein L,D-transpeptidase YcbB/YkuD
MHDREDTTVRRIAVVIMISLLWLPAARANTPTMQTRTLDAAMRQHLSRHLAGVSTPSARLEEMEPLWAPEAVRRFYADRDYRLAWSSPWGLSSHVDTLLEALRMAEREGLPLLNTHLRAIDAHLAEIRQGDHTALNTASLVALDLLLSDAFFTFVHQLRPSLSHRQTDDSTELPEADRVQRLHRALATGDLEAAWRPLLPTHSTYTGLQRALSRYRDIAANGGWSSIGEGPTLRPGDRGLRVLLLRHRLEVTGDLLAAFNHASDIFGRDLEQAVRAFQRRHGLHVDGVVDPKTRRALDVPARCRVQQIALNMARWRQLPHDLGDRYIQVNIPDFTLDVIEHGGTIMHMRVIVGKPSWPTPGFSHTVRYLVLNPYWNVPSSIATREILPKVKQDPSYLDVHNMEVLSGWEEDAAQVNPLSVDWSAVQPQTFQYRFRQKPGPGNALGRIKFMFPNAYNVYLHDTSAEALFTRSSRAFSHGCVRVARPVDLAEYLLQNQASWTRQRLLEVLNQDTQRRIELPEPVPIHLIYQTAWMDADGTLQFRNDIYGYDQIDACHETEADAKHLATIE